MEYITNKEGTIYYFDKDPGYDTIKRITNGLCSVLHLIDGRTLFVNERGNLVSPINNEASKMYGIKIYGNIVIVGKIINS
tara:strand:+ start:1661 stop:1900 length:240 start_codon:yes stop_codon:yes gene_type:complete